MKKDGRKMHEKIQMQIQIQWLTNGSPLYILVFSKRSAAHETPEIARKIRVEFMSRKYIFV